MIQDLNGTVYYKETANQIGSSIVTIFDGNEAPQTIDLKSFNKHIIYFGRDPKNDIVLTSRLVSTDHGQFVNKGGTWYIEDKAAYKDSCSTNGLIYNNADIVSHFIGNGDLIRIDDGIETVAEGVLFVFSSADSDNKWHSVQLSEKRELTVG